MVKNIHSKLLYYPVAISHILIVLSLEEDTKWSPVGINDTDDTLWSWPKNKFDKKGNYKLKDDLSFLMLNCPKSWYVS